MTCEEVRDYVNPHSKKEPPDLETDEELWAHIAQCGRCKEYVDKKGWMREPGKKYTLH